MTENKRFMIGDDTKCPVIEGKFELNREEVVDLLNKQYEYLNILRKELELVYKKYTELEKENKQLKQENKALKMELKRLYGAEEDDDDYDLWIKKQVERSRDLE